MSETAAPDSQAIERVPRVITGARAFLGIVIVVWVIGVWWSAASIWRLATGDAHVVDLSRFVGVTVWRVGLLSAAAFAYRGTRRRRPSARWITIGLALVALYFTIPGLTLSWRGLNGDFRVPQGLIAPASAEEAGMMLFLNVVLVVCLVVLIWRLAAGRSATRYFATRG